MKKELSKTEAKEKIESFFQKESFSAEETRKIKRIAMKYRISLKEHKKQFCKKCLSRLAGKIRITKTHKTITCQKCNHQNRFKIQ